jgi:hypothetical protein
MCPTAPAPVNQGVAIAARPVLKTFVERLCRHDPVTSSRTVSLTTILSSPGNKRGRGGARGRLRTTVLVPADHQATRVVKSVWPSSGSARPDGDVSRALDRNPAQGSHARTR